MVHCLPPVHYDVLQYLITFLSQVSEVVMWAIPSYHQSCLVTILLHSSSFPSCMLLPPSIPLLPLLLFPTSFSLHLSLPQVAQNHEVNKMTSLNLAIVLGPNLVWSTNEITILAALGEINNFTFLLINNCSDIFEHKP